MVAVTPSSTCFLQSEDAVRFARIHAQIDPKCRALDTAFGSEYAQAEENLRNDPELGIEEKFGFVEMLADSDSADASLLRDEVIGYCRAHQRMGAEIPGRHQFRFGHVMLRERLIDRLASVDDPTDPHTLTTRGADLSVDAILTADLDRQRFDLQDVILSPYQMWCIYQPESPLDPYHGVDCRGSELRRRLGLGFYKSDAEFLYCNLDLRNGPPAHRPTTLDADLNPFFRPGGRTFPLDEADDGLSEVVHEPVSGDRLSQPIRPALT